MLTDKQRYALNRAASNMKDRAVEHANALAAAVEAGRQFDRSYNALHLLAQHVDEPDHECWREGFFA